MKAVLARPFSVRQVVRAVVERTGGECPPMTLGHWLFHIGASSVSGALAEGVDPKHVYMRIIAFMTERDDIDRGRNANGQPAHQTLALELVDLLPGGSDDRCAERLTHELAEKNTVVDKVHVIDRDTLKPRLCVHYDADAVTASEIQRHALQAAQTINTEYGHLRWAMVETEGVAPAQSAALIDRLSSTPGVVAAVVTRDSVEVEFQRTRVTAQELVDIIAAGPAPTPPASSATAFDDRHAGKADDHSEHEHSHGGIFGERSELIFAGLAGALLLVGWLLATFTDTPRPAELVVYSAAFFFGGAFFTVQERSPASDRDASRSTS